MPRTSKQGDNDGPKNGTGAGGALGRWKARGAAGEPADWTAVDGRWMAAAAAALGSLGGAIRFGYTRDGGAYAIGIYVGDEHHTDYLKPGESVEQYLAAIVEEFNPKLG